MKRYDKKNKPLPSSEGRIILTDLFHRNNFWTERELEKKIKQTKRRLERLESRAAVRPRPDNCESCGNPERFGLSLSFDHCHASGRFRGWLCLGCNTALGMCRNDPARLRALADYQERFLQLKLGKIPLAVECLPASEDESPSFVITEGRILAINWKEGTGTIVMEGGIEAYFSIFEVKKWLKKESGLNEKVGFLLEQTSRGLRASRVSRIRSGSNFRKKRYQ